MIQTNNNVVLRNIQEQVQKNKEDIARHYEIDRTLANFGIKIVGQVTTSEELPDPLTYTGEYGDAYAVGDKAAVDAGLVSYKYYIFTRPDPNAGEPENHWLDVGELGIKGDKGETGPVGPEGPEGPSSKWWITGAITGGSTVAADVKEGDFALASNGSVFVASKEGNKIIWKFYTNIKGPKGDQGPIGLTGLQGEQGIRGPQGIQGVPGKAVYIAGVLDNSSQLENYNPVVIRDLARAYLVGTTDPYDLWIQVGTSPVTAVWRNIGEFTVGTQLFNGNITLSMWDINDAVLKPSYTLEASMIYSADTNKSTQMLTVGEGLAIEEGTLKSTVSGRPGNLLTNPLFMDEYDDNSQLWKGISYEHTLEFFNPQFYLNLPEGILDPSQGRAIYMITLMSEYNSWR